MSDVDGQRSRRSSPPQSKARSGAADSVRVLGILAVVAGHTLAWPIVRPLLYSWHVPLFFFLAGYFWSSDRPLRQEVSARTRSLLRPLIAWFVLIGIPFVLLDATMEDNTWARLAVPFVNGQRSAMPYTTFWFAAVLFFSAVILRGLWTLPKPVIWSVAACGLIVSFTAGPQLARTPLSIGSALPCIVFLTLGAVARTLRPRIRRAGRVGLGLLLVSAVSAGVGFTLPLDVKQGDFGTPVISTVVAVAISFGLVLVAEALFEHLPPTAGRIATNLSYAGFMVILTHPLILWLMRTFGPPVPDWLLFAICLTIPWAAALAVLRSPVSGWLTGVHRQGRHQTRLA